MSRNTHAAILDGVWGYTVFCLLNKLSNASLSGLPSFITSSNNAQPLITAGRDPTASRQRFTWGYSSMSPYRQWNNRPLNTERC